MSSVSRRDMLGAAVTTGAAFGAAAIAHAEPTILPIDSVKKTGRSAALYHCDFGDPGRYDNDPRALKVVIVTHSAGIKFFLNDLGETPWAMESIDPQLIERVAALTKYGLEVYLCRVTFSTLKIDTAKARTDSYIKFVASGIATAAALQDKGFSYLKVG
jgi:intracellular sulfur oxidation DsrE/DsrF family protein